MLRPLFPREKQPSVPTGYELGEPQSRSFYAVTKNKVSATAVNRTAVIQPTATYCTDVDRITIEIQRKIISVSE
jgi:hypothetical protein